MQYKQFEDVTFVLGAKENNHQVIWSSKKQRIKCAKTNLN